jgi:cysteine desulfuration protein SufE
VDGQIVCIDLGNAGLRRKTQNDKIYYGLKGLAQEMNDGIITFQGESDAILVKGIVSLLIQVLSGHTPDEIINSELYFIDKIGLKEHLSPTRSNGLVAMVKQMKMYALAYKAKTNN